MSFPFQHPLVQENKSLELDGFRHMRLVNAIGFEVDNGRGGDYTLNSHQEDLESVSMLWDC